MKEWKGAQNTLLAISAKRRTKRTHIAVSRRTGGRGRLKLWAAGASRFGPSACWAVEAPARGETVLGVGGMERGALRIAGGGLGRWGRGAMMGICGELASTRAGGSSSAGPFCLTSEMTAGVAGVEGTAEDAVDASVVLESALLPPSDEGSGRSSRFGQLHVGQTQSRELTVKRVRRDSGRMEWKGAHTLPPDVCAPRLDTLVHQLRPPLCP